MIERKLKDVSDPLSEEDEDSTPGSGSREDSQTMSRKSTGKKEQAKEKGNNAPLMDNLYKY